MAWRSVVVTQHCKISFRLNNLIIQTDDETYDFPISDVGLLLIATTRCVVTSYAMAELLDRNIKVIFSNDKGIPIGETVPYEVGQGRRDRITDQLSWSQDKKDVLWKHIIGDKIYQQGNVLKRCESADYECVANLANEVQNGDCTNRESVAAHLYFPRLFSYEFIRSDTDNEINALLDYGYSILLSETARKISELGYLNDFGIHHDNARNPFNLASDFMEPFRPYVDECVFHMGDKKLDSSSKSDLIRLLRDDQEDLHTSLAVCMADYIRKALSYMQGEGDPPTLRAEK